MKAEDEHQASSWTQFDPETGRCTLETSTLSLGILDQIESMTLFDLLEVINPDRGHCTCVGQAPSKGRRCQNPIAQHNRQSAFTLIDCLEQDYLDKNPKKKALQEIASLLLCVRYHRDQAEQVARKWHSRIDSSFSSTHTYKSSAPPRSSLRPCWSKKPTAPSTESFSWSTTHSSGSISFDNLPDEAYMYELLRNLYKQSKDRKQRQNPNAAFTNAEEGDQDIANDTPEMKREGQERRYESPRDHQPKARSGPNSSTFKKEEDDAAYNEYKKSRDRDDRNERIRQQARKAREEQERSKREKVEAEKQRWAQSWSLYTLRWDKLEESEGCQDAAVSIPWPVLSGDRSDVVRSNVEMFFKKCITDTCSNAEAFKKLRVECLRWHPDKIVRIFGDTQPGPVDRMIVDMIARVVITLRAEARSRRNQ